MFNPKKLESDDILGLCNNIAIDNELHVWNEDDFYDALENPNRPIFTISDFGFIAFSKVLDEAEILMIWIAPKQRGQNHGKKLLEYAINELRRENINNIFLEVAIDNDAAIKLYQNMGFETFSRRKNYYKRDNGINIDALMMRL